MQISPRLSAQLEAVEELESLDWYALVSAIDEDPETFFMHSDLTGFDFSHTDMRNMSIAGSYIDGIRVQKGHLTEEQTASAASAVGIIWLENADLEAQNGCKAEEQRIVPVDFQKSHGTVRQERKPEDMELPIAALSNEGAHTQALNQELPPYVQGFHSRLGHEAILARIDTDIGVVDFLMNGNAVLVNSTRLRGSSLLIEGHKFELEQIEDSESMFAVKGITPLRIRALLQKARRPRDVVD